MTVKTCAGCTVELFQASPGPNDQNSVGAISYLSSHHQLNRRLIPVRRTQSYTFRVRARLPGPYRLHVALRDGSEETAPVD